MLNIIVLEAIVASGATGTGIVGTLWGISPILGILAIGIVYLVTELKKKNSELSELNKYIRDSEKENLSTLKQVNDTIDRVLENQKLNDNVILKEIDNLKQLLLVKLRQSD